MSRLADERQNEEGSMTDLVDYQQDGVGIKVRLDAAHDTVWLRQEQMGELFGRERSVITKHLRNIFAEGELEEESNVQNLHIAGSDKPVRFYSLDVIISVGYRVKSQQGTRFRQWASRWRHHAFGALSDGHGIATWRSHEAGQEVADAARATKPVA
jgi:hypothetical protein